MRLALLLVSILSCVHGSCKYKGKQICEGAVTKVTGKFLRICTEGKVLKKKVEEVEPGYPMAGGGKLMNQSIEHNLTLQNVFGTEKFYVMELLYK